MYAWWLPLRLYSLSSDPPADIRPERWYVYGITLVRIRYDAGAYRVQRWYVYGTTSPVESSPIVFLFSPIESHLIESLLFPI